MKLLLDTHVWIWSQNDPTRLGPQTRRLLVAAEHENHVCPISTLEVARLAAAGAITLSMAIQDWVEAALQALVAATVPVSHAMAMEAYALPGSFHKDPADRLLVAAARCHALTPDRSLRPRRRGCGAQGLAARERGVERVVRDARAGPRTVTRVVCIGDLVQ